MLLLTNYKRPTLDQYSLLCTFFSEFRVIHWEIINQFVKTIQLFKFLSHLFFFSFKWKYIIWLQDTKPLNSRSNRVCGGIQWRTQNFFIEGPICEKCMTFWNIKKLGGHYVKYIWNWRAIFKISKNLGANCPPWLHLCPSQVASFSFLYIRGTN